MDDEHRYAFHAYRRFLAVGVCLLLIGGALLAWPWNGPASPLSNGPDSPLVAKAPPFVIERLRTSQRLILLIIMMRTSESLITCVRT